MYRFDCMVLLWNSPVKKVVPPIGGTPYIPLIKKAFPERSGENSLSSPLKIKKKKFEIF
tara:strand:+ start:89 stop:265 length:177 start_codon:yes stop_codon:yes gene_type:complete